LVLLTKSPCVAELQNSEVELTWQATIRGRLGYVNGPWLIYGTGGVAFAHVNRVSPMARLNGGPFLLTAYRYA
jgi:opacity protein-like surface antigen